MKVCPACATENSSTSQSCSACGGSLDSAQTATVFATTRKQPRDAAPASDSDSSLHGRFLPGTKIAERYRIVSLAGRGGMGEVYRADDLNLGSLGTFREIHLPCARPVQPTDCVREAVSVL
jgi:hypothetical protein